MTDRDRLIELLDGAEDLPTCQTYAGFADYLLANGVTLGKPLSEYLHPIEAYEGLKGKYLVFKADTGEQIVNCFVFRPDKDNTAVEALRFYAYTTENKTLAEDIHKWVGKSKILPPCKVGDILYKLIFFKDGDGGCVPQKVVGFHLGKFPHIRGQESTQYIIVHHEVINTISHIDIKQLGKTVFLTKEEAEEKLKELGK